MHNARMNRIHSCRYLLTLACLASGALPAADMPVPSAAAASPVGTAVASPLDTLSGLRQRERWGEVRVLARALLKDAPASPDAHAALVEALWRQGRLTEALAAAEAARAARADSAALRLAQAGALSLLARWPDVTQTLAPDLEKATASPDALLLAGIALREQGRSDAARPLLDAMTRRFPADRRGWINLARLEVQAKRPAQALAALSGLPANDDEVLFLKAQAQSLAGQVPAAIASLTAALAQAPHRASLYALRASLLANVQQWPDAARDIHTALLLGAHAAGDYLLACEAARMLQDADAHAAYARAGIGAYPQRVEFPLQLARALREQGKVADALASLEAALTRFPGHASLVMEMALSQSMLGRDADVVATLSPLLAREPLAPAYALRAYAWLHQGQHARADEDAANALALDPSQANALLVQARVALLQQKVPRANEACRRALSRAPMLAWAYTTCGEVALQQDRRDEARRLVAQALLLSPQDAEALQLRERLASVPGSGEPR